MLASIQAYCQGIIDGLPMPQGIPGPLVARITPPVAEKISAPKAYVWGGRLRSKRQTAPRGPGFREFPWTVDVWLVYLDSPDDAFRNEPFPQVIDTVMRAFMTTTMPLFISAAGEPVGPNATAKTDTQVQGIGETFDLDYPPEKTVTSLRQVWYTARLGIEVLEVVQA